MKKKVITVVLLVVMLMSAISVSSYAATKANINVPSTTSWSASKRVTLSKNLLGNTKSGKVRVTMSNWGVNLDIKMSYNGKIVWSQNNAIISSGKSAYIYRDFSLGNDHPYYDIALRTSRKVSAAPSVTITGQSNVSKIA